ACCDGCPANTCGDGVTDIVAGETCDDGPNNNDDYSLLPHCNSTCDGLAPHCGDLVVGHGEFCDDGQANSAGWSATRHCNSDCTGWGLYCGDNILSSPRESCGDSAVACNIPFPGNPEVCSACACGYCAPPVA